MVITVDDDSQAVLDLLWVREAWELEPVGDDLPPRLAHGPARVSETVRADASADPVSWQQAWPGLWQATLAHAARPHDPCVFEALGRTDDGSPERRELLGRLIGPRAREDFGEPAFADPAYLEWTHARFQEHMLRRPLNAEDQPERRSLDALIRAWRAGLEKVVAIPCVGTFTRMLGPHTLLVTGETRRDPARYAEALAWFAESR
ncbi:hypothetical protein ET445_00770 [Agromyces protaetiae]|uniref:Uncharacterized protein n=2 Tax=Agromyces protaetiae TaxID=2509455 RepID=A0A4P6FVZ2_9MICO|nr:hypothetical protein ET445_00770 [Agromyces protaetiae]